MPCWVPKLAQAETSPKMQPRLQQEDVELDRWAMPTGMLVFGLHQVSSQAIRIHTCATAYQFYTMQRRILIQPHSHIKNTFLHVLTMCTWVAKGERIHKCTEGRENWGKWHMLTVQIYNLEQWIISDYWKVCRPGPCNTFIRPWCWV